MTDRSITIRLRADVAQAITGLRAGSAAVKDFSGQTLTYAAKHEQALTRLSKASLVAGGVIGAGFVLAARAAAEFDKAMSSVKANVDNKTAPSMDRLRKAALLAGQTTAFTATQAAEAENELAKAGIGAADIVGGALRASLTLASAGQIDLAQSAEILSATMVQFSLSGKDAAHIADVLSAGADKSLGGVQDLGEALKYAGVQSSQFGVSLDQTVGVLAEFASRGILGSMAGTGLRQVMLSLTAPTVEGAAAMRRYGIDVFDAQGKFVGLDKVAGQLHDNLGGLTQAQQQNALATIFTNRALAEANILMQDGAKGVRTWTQRVNDAQFAARQAATKMDNLSGDLTKLRNSFNVALIETGEQSVGALRDITQALDGVIHKYDELDPAAKGFVITLGAQVAGAALLAGGLGYATVKVASLTKAMRELNIASSTIKSGGVIGAVLAGLTIGADLAIADTNAHKAKDIHAAQTDPSVLAADRKRLADLQRQNAAPSRLPVRFGGTPKASNAVEIQRLQAVIKAATAAQDENTLSLQSAQKAGDSLVPTLIATSNGYRAGYLDVTIFTKSLDALRQSILPLQSAEDQLTSDSHNLAAAVKAQAKQFHDTGKAVRGNSTEALANRAALRGLTADAIGVVEAYAKQGHSSDEVATKTGHVRDRFIKLAEKAGFTKKQIKEYVAQIDLVPAQIQSSIVLSGFDQATLKLQLLKQQLGSLSFHAFQKDSGAITPTRQATGGHVAGPGTGTSDSIPAWLSNGEYVINAASAQRIGYGNLDRLNRYAAGGMVRRRGRFAFADGGLVGDPDLSSIFALLNGVSTSHDDVTNAVKSRARADAALIAAESRLRKLRHGHASHADISAQERRVAADRIALSQATAKLTATERSYAASRKPIADRFAAAAASSVRKDASFLSNLNRIARRGFTYLAQQLLSEGDDDAKAIAAQAARWPDAKLSGLQGSLQRSAQLQGQLSALFGGTGSSAAVQGQGAMVIYVQNPVTSEYLLAKMDSRAKAIVATNGRQVSGRPR